jgi:hypothetical protein
MWDNSIAAKKERRIDTKKNKKKKSTTVLDMTLSGICPTLKNPFNQRSHNNMGVDLTIEVLYVYAQLTPGNPQQVHQVRSPMYMYFMKLEDFL